MDLMQRVYSTLVVTSAGNFGSLISQLLPETHYYPVKYVKSITEARRAILIRQYDIIIVNTPLPDAVGTEFAMDASKEGNAVVLVLAGGTQVMEIEAKLRYSGVFLLKKPTSMPSLTQALQWTRTASDRVKKAQNVKTSMEEKMDEIRLVNRAKWILIENLKMTEEEAHKFITRQAMDKCVSKREIANTILSTYKN